MNMQLGADWQQRAMHRVARVVRALQGFTNVWLGLCNWLQLHENL